MNTQGPGVRTLAVLCPQWSAHAVGHPADVPLVVLHANRVTSLNPAAGSQGVKPGQSSREAQARCPALEVHTHDEQRDARAFETILGAIEELVPRLEVVAPGHCLFPTRGPSRYHGGDKRLAVLIRDRVRALVGSCQVGVGIADGPRTASIAARESVTRDGGSVPVVIPAGSSRSFLSSLPIGCLDGVLDAETIGLLRRLGLRTVGRLAALPAPDVSARFGPKGLSAHRLARGLENEVPDLRDVPVDLKVSAAVDPPAERVDRVAFLAKSMADTLHDEMSSRGLACTRILVVAETETDDRSERLWRHEGALSSAAIAQRVRWQLEGWLGTGKFESRCNGGISKLELVPDQVCADNGVQLGFWGGSNREEQRAAKGLVRIQALLGADSVLVPEWQGGRAPVEQYRLVPLDVVDLSTRTPRGVEPWPGRMPEPSPAVICQKVLPASVVDVNGNQVGVSGRGLISSSPHECSLAGGPWQKVRAWAGPWCVDERWWDPVAHRRRARIQMVLGPTERLGTAHPSRGTAHLLTLEAGQWWLEASYD